MLLLLLSLLGFGLSLLMFLVESLKDDLLPQLKNANNWQASVQENLQTYPLTSLFLCLSLFLGVLGFELNQWHILSKRSEESFVNRLHLNLDYALSFDALPSVKGPHLDKLLPWQSYETELSDEAVLHNMEEGGVVFWYRAGSAEENQTKSAFLANTAASYPKSLVVPRTGLASAYMVTIWGHRLEIDSPEQLTQKLERFLQQHKADS